MGWGGDGSTAGFAFAFLCFWLRHREGANEDQLLVESIVFLQLFEHFS